MSETKEVRNFSDPERAKRAAIEAEYISRKENVCSNCVYFPNGAQKSLYASVGCEYLIITGHMRPCEAGMCKEAGVFKAKKKAGKKG